jgi:hypothetical protein
MKVHPIVYFIFKSMVRLALVLIFIGIPAAVYYQRVHGIGFGAKESLGRALSSPTLEVNIGHLSINPFMGLVARDVRVQERGNNARALASINQVAISISLGELMLRRVIVDSLSLREADASIPLPKSPDDRRVTIKGINAEIILLGDSMRVSSFAATIEGIRILFSGEVQNPFALQLPEHDRNPNPPGQDPAFEKVLVFLS